VRAGEQVVVASAYRTLQQQVRELQRLLSKKALENEILARRWNWRSKRRLLRAPSPVRDNTR
jgi:transposase